MILNCRLIVSEHGIGESSAVVCRGVLGIYADGGGEVFNRPFVVPDACVRQSSPHIVVGIGRVELDGRREAVDRRAIPSGHKMSPSPVILFICLGQSFRFSSFRSALIHQRTFLSVLHELLSSLPICFNTEAWRDRRNRTCPSWGSSPAVQGHRSFCGDVSLSVARTAFPMFRVR